jgi:hypothetical protein
VPSIAIAAIALLFALCSPAEAAAGTEGSAPATSIGASIDATRLGAVVPSNFLGLSFETSMLGSPALAGTSPVLATLLGNLGPGVLRIGGVSVDRTQWMGVPEAVAPWSIATIAPADLARLSSLISASGWHLLLGLNLGHVTAAAVVEEARAASTMLGRSLQGVMIGNEPDLYTHPSSAPFRRTLGAAPLRPRGWGAIAYESEISSLRAALAAAAPVALYGPDTATPRWLGSYATAQGAGLAALAQHFYPLDRCSRGRLLPVAATPRGLLSEGIARRELRDVSAFMRVAASHSLALRIDEANSVACAGQPGTSNTFAAALWAVEFGLIAAERGVAGINFHGGLGSCTQGGTISSPWYSPLCTLPSGQLVAQPEYYALLLLHSLEGSAFVPVSCRTSRNIAVHALREPGGALQVVIGDMEVRAPRAHAPKPRTARRGVSVLAPVAKPAWVALSAGPSYTHARVVTLAAPSASATHGVSLGGASVRADGSIAEPLEQPAEVSGGRVLVRVRPTSVAVVTLSP